MLINVFSPRSNIIKIWNNSRKSVSSICKKNNGSKFKYLWWNYWDKCITFERSFNARLNYTHWNAVKHGLVRHPLEYPFTSYHEHMAAHPELMPILERNHPFDRLRVPDDF